jgi:LacI family transcriptional regulator/LacI family repressor for deo operon, udp, cdd, tsx, nupC, and nupG
MGPAEHQHQTEDVADGKALLPELLRAGVSAVFCINDMVAIGALLASRELGLSVPDQFSISGFDDIETAQYVTPPLTTVHQPKLRLGQTAMEMMLDLWSGRPVEDQVLPTELVERGTTAALLAVLDTKERQTTSSGQPRFQR